MKIYLVTHAHTEQLVDVAADRWCLSARGLQQAEALEQSPFWDEVDRVILSSEAKTWLTVAHIVTAYSLPVWIDARFDELRRSGWIENYAEQVAAAFASPHEAIGEWETVASVRQRALSGLADLQRRFGNETLALVGHELCHSILRAELLGHESADFSAWQKLEFATSACFALNPCRMIRDFELNIHRVR